ncbi:MAG: hypothetical protein VR73_05830 [Gammaproteobacteria bacterium BRH_c0]|nr:MAG: hypothetical protein VR73_05830 [Gammaproteobacteria bacterium BRH_c0]
MLMPDGSLWANFFHADQGYIISFPALAEFWIAADGLETSCTRNFGVSKSTIDHLYLNQILPLALSRQFKLVLHGGAIEINDLSVAFLGASGAGKSTLTSSFATNGHGFLTDDGLQLELINGKCLAQPSHPSIRLWHDSHEALMPEGSPSSPPVDYTPKTRFLAGDAVLYCGEPRPLRAIYLLGDGSTPSISIQSVSSRDAIIELVRHSFLLDIEERAMLTHHFGQLTDLVKSVSFFRLDYPRRYDYLPDVRQAVIAHAKAL